MSISPLTLLATVASTNSEEPALEAGSVVVTYRALAEHVAGVAQTLNSPGERIGLCGGRTIASAIGFWGVLAAGCSVVPLGIGLPGERRDRIINASGLTTILADAEVPDELISAWSARGLRVIRIDTCGRARTSIFARPSGDAEAYVLFTSGSTGEPKGVRITHANLLAYARNAGSTAGLGPGARVSSNYEQTFDASMFDRVAALTHGACVVLPDRREYMNPVAYVNRGGLTHWYSVPSAIRLAAKMRVLQAGSMPSLTYSAFIGESLFRVDAEAWKHAAPDSRLVNAYGPTEATVSCFEWSSAADIRSWPETSNGTLPIGEAYPDCEWTLVKSGLAGRSEGEMCVRGVQRLPAYLSPSDDAGRFYEIVGDQARPVEGSVTPDHWYRTGDRCLASPDGVLHLGRIDRQVQLMGYRVELGDVESAMREIPGVDDAVVLVEERHTGKSLVGCFSGDALDHREMVKYLAERLPRYMLPGRTVHFDSIPVNDRGKTDTATLKELLALHGDVQ